MRWAGVDAGRVRLLPPAIDLSTFSPGPKSAKLCKELGLEGRTVLLTVGRLVSEERYKGFDEVLEALPALARERPNIVYLICGDGTDRVRLEEKAIALGVRDRVRFAGYVKEVDKSDYYRLADAYVMPSRGEGFGIVFLEALAVGLPVMGSRLDGSREALLSGELGELVDPSNLHEVQRGVLRALERPRHVPEKLRRFSMECYRKRVGVLVGDVLNFENASVG
jgi:glycosyltransferase involved in cell wall biosynthesis